MAEPAAPKTADELLKMTAEVVSAYVSNNTLATGQLADVIQAVYSSLRGLEGQGAEPPSEPLRPAVPIRKSVTPEFLICLEDGKKLKMLKRHLRSTYNLTPDEYRAKWGLAQDYPMVAPKYAAQRSEFARSASVAAPVAIRRGHRRKNNPQPTGKAEKRAPSGALFTRAGWPLTAANSARRAE
jgi:predicted transcriptional regulator